MDEPPADALRRKKDSSMRVAINLVKDGDGAGLRLGRQHRRADGDLALRAEDAAGHRPSGDRLAAADAHGRDDGARPRRQRQLHARAARAVRGDGQRARHRGRRHRAADGGPAQHRRGGHQGQRRREGRPRELLKASGLNFYGNVEGNDIYKGTTDVVVCDGFVGNVVLKASEGLVTMLYDFLKAEFTRNPLTQARRARSPIRC